MGVFAGKTVSIWALNAMNGASGSVPGRMAKTLPNSSRCTSVSESSANRSASHKPRAFSPHGGAGTAVTCSCRSSRCRVCERNHAKASCTRRSSAIRATCCCADLERCDSLAEPGCPEEARTGGLGPMRMSHGNTGASRAKEPRVLSPKLATSLRRHLGLHAVNGVHAIHDLGIGQRAT
jgi:hypothetical protein